MAKDLEGVLVISVEQAVAAPYASMKLADAGARVIKIERPEGDFARNYDALVNGGSAYFIWLNRGKESICLDLKQHDDLQVLKALIAKADVLIQNLIPGAMDRLGLGIEELIKQYPALITCSISGYGSTGPASKQKAYDLLIQAESGLCAINGTPEGPARVGVSVCDIAAGMTAYQSILQALYARTGTGRGRALEVSLYNSMADWMNVPYLQYRYGNKPAQRQGLQHPTIAPYGAYDCADGKTVLISIQNEREWQRLCTHVLGDAEIAARAVFETNSKRVENRLELDALVQDTFIQHTREENILLLEKADIAFGRLSDLDDLLSHPQNRFTSVNTEFGDVELLAPGSMIVGQEENYGAVPQLDQHGAAIRAEFVGG